MDEKTTVGSLIKQVSEFRDARGWLKFDTPRSLAISISVEAAELLEHFQWKDDTQMREALISGTTRDEVASELADVLIYCMGFADVLGIDLSEAIMRKLRKNSEKYPVISQEVSA
jgi:NTP pyrophosphatase (non-canonical NTP hydrolase)